MATNLKNLSFEEHSKLKSECLQIIADNCNFKNSKKRDDAIKLLSLLNKHVPEEVDPIADIKIDIEL